MSELSKESIVSPEYKEYGKNVEIVLKFIRHGERDVLGNLTDYGRAVTRRRAQESAINQSDFDAVKAIGSIVGPKGPSGMQRSLETADIYAHEIAGDEAFRTRQNKILSYETLKHSIPFDYTAFYNSHLPENFDTLSDEDKVLAAKRAQQAVINYLINLHSPEAENYKKEAAGSFAYLIDHYEHMAKRLKPNSKVLIPAGTHGGMMEFILQQSLVSVDANGQKKIGFQDLEEIGGEFDPSESFNVIVATDETGEQQALKVTFDNRNRPQGEFYLDNTVVTELKNFYIETHSL